MKKVVAFILSFVYLVTSNGATINFHYCMGKLIGADVSAAAFENSTCSNCGMVKENKKGCCNDKHEVIKLSSDQIFTADNIVLNNTFHYVNIWYPSFENNFIPLYADVDYSAHSPPLSSKPLFILYRVFQI